MIDNNQYLRTDAAKAPLHGIYAIYPLRIPKGTHTTAKYPCDIDGDARKGVYHYTHTAAEVMAVLSSPADRKRVIASIRKHLISTAAAKASKAMRMPDVVADYGDRDISDDEFCQIIASDPRLTAAAEWKHIEAANITLLLGRRFDASIDGIAALNCDGHHPPAEWSAEAIYREVSSSKTGDHILYRIADGLIPGTSGNKTKATIDGRKYELFYRPGSGLAISGMEAIANPSAPILNMESPAGRIIGQLITSANTTAPTAGTVGSRRGRRKQQKLNYYKLL